MGRLELFELETSAHGGGSGRSMLFLLMGLVLFLGVHGFAATRSRSPGNLRDRYGRIYMVVFSILSLAGFGLLVWGYGLARGDAQWNSPFWVAPEWTRHLIMALMLPSMVLLMSAYAPFGHIRRYVRHPMLAAIMIWAVAHLIYNGNLPSVLLFGGFLAYSVFSRIQADKRGEDDVRHRVPSAYGDLTAVTAGVGLYVAFIFVLHQVLIGVPVLPST